MLDPTRFDPLVIEEFDQGLVSAPFGAFDEDEMIYPFSRRDNDYLQLLDVIELCVLELLLKE